MPQPKVRDHFSPSEDKGISFIGDPGKTDQSQAEDCDVNVIVNRFMKTGVLPGIDVERVYGDFTDVPSYQQSMEIVLKAQEQFDGLEARIRKRFSNDPSLFLEFVNDPRNAEEMVKLGLATARPVEKTLPNGSTTEPAKT